MKYVFYAFIMIVLSITMLTASCGEQNYTASDTVTEMAASKFPDASAVILLKRREHTFKLRTGLVETGLHEIIYETEIKQIRRVKVLSEKGIEEFGDYLSHTFNNKYQKYEIEASITSSNGKTQKVSDSDIHKIDVGSNYVQYRIAFPGIAIGSVIEVREKIKSEYPMLSGEWDFGAKVPTVRSEFVFTAPKGTKVRFNLTPKENLTWLEPEVDGKYETYTITKEVVPPNHTEKYMSPDHIGNPSLSYLVWNIQNRVIENTLNLMPGTLKGPSYVMNWRRVGKEFAEYFDPVSWEYEDDAATYRFALDQIIFDLKQMDPGNSDSLLCSLLQYYHEEFQPVEDELFYSISNPEESFVLKEGGPYELAYVLNTLLRKSGMDTKIVLVRDADKGFFDSRTPSYSAFNHPLIRVNNNNKTYWVDPFNHYCDLNQLPWMSRGVDGMQIFSTGKHKFITIPLNPSSSNCVHSLTEAEIDKEGNLSCATTVTLTGQYCLNLRRSCGMDGSDRLDEELSEMIKSYYPEMYDGETLEMIMDTGDSITVTFLYLEEGFADVSGNLMNIDFSSWTGSSLINVFENDTRYYDIQFPFLKRESAEISITIPEGARITEAPTAGELSNEFLDYIRIVNIQDNTIKLKRNLTVKTPTIMVKDYSAMRQFATEIYNFDSETVVLEM